ncbi:hypothetical protein Dimus_014250 [Dionaea muscipula]
MELFFELVLTLSLSFMFTFLFAKVIFMSSRSHTNIHGDDDDDYSVPKPPRDYLIKKPKIDERYFDAKKEEEQDHKVQFCKEVIKVDRFSRLSIVEEHVKIEEQPLESVEFLNDDDDDGDGDGDGDFREVRVVELEEKAGFSARSSGDDVVDVTADELRDKSRERTRVCGIEIESSMDAEAEATDRGRGIELNDWETIEMNDIEDLLLFGNQGVYVNDEILESGIVKL